MLPRLEEGVALQESTRGPLNQRCSSLTTDLLGEAAALNSAPPRLNHNGTTAQVLVVLVSNPAPNVLLYECDQIVQARRPQRLEQSDHSGTEEDLGQSDLVLVLVLEGALKQQLTECLDVRVVLPFLGWNENIVTGRSIESYTNRTYRLANSSKVQRLGYPAQLMRMVSRTPQARSCESTCWGSNAHAFLASFGLIQRI